MLNLWHFWGIYLFSWFFCRLVFFLLQLLLHVFQEFWFIYFGFCVFTLCASSWGFWCWLFWSFLLPWFVFCCHILFLSISCLVFELWNHSMVTALELYVMFLRKETFIFLFYRFFSHTFNLYLCLWYYRFLNGFFLLLFRFFKRFTKILR